MAEEKAVLTDEEKAIVAHVEHEIGELEKPFWKLSPGQWIVTLGLVAAVVGIFYFISKPSGEPRGIAALASPSIATMEPRIGKLTGPPSKFRWESISGANKYLFTVSGWNNTTPLIERTVPTSQLELTADEQAKISGKGSYNWKVQARSSQGAILAEGKGAFNF